MTVNVARRKQCGIQSGRFHSLLPDMPAAATAAVWDRTAMKFGIFDYIEADERPDPAPAPVAALRAASS
jgi:hypothetical protein